MSFRHNHCFRTLNTHFEIHLLLIAINTKKKGENMKALSTGIFILTMTASGVFTGNCAKHNKANLEAMACEAGFTWNEASAECVKDTA